MCKNDAGGVVLLQKSWTTFNKATLNCSTEDGRRFDQLEAVYELPDSHLVFAVFTTVGSNVLPGSAICVYDQAAFRAAFAGPYLYQTSPSAPWIRHPNNYKYFDVSCLDSPIAGDMHPHAMITQFSVKYKALRVPILARLPSSWLTRSDTS